MKPYELKKSIENKFDAYCKQAIRGEQLNYFDHLDRLVKKEISFSTLGENSVNHFSITDKKPSDYYIFSVQGEDIHIKNDQLNAALKQLSNKKREILLLHYFLEMSDQEIGELLGLHRSNVYRNRKNALSKIRDFLEVEFK